MSSDLVREYNVAVANGLLHKAGQIDRRIKSLERWQPDNATVGGFYV